MTGNDIVIVGTETVSAFGNNAQLNTALREKRIPFAKENRFPVSQFKAQISAHAPGIAKTIDLLYPLLPTAQLFPAETPLFFTSTIGSVEELETAKEDTVLSLFRKAMRLFRTHNGRIISAACAGGNMAIIRAAEAIRSGRIDHAIAAGCDSVTEFVFSGFASLDALSPEVPHPYCKDRKGLVLGDGAGIVLLSSRKFAESNALKISGVLAGWGASCDACHITAPDANGSGLAAALRKALGKHQPQEIGAILGHGTGTLFNDAMELAALRHIFPEPVPLTSLKGATGHTLAASGLIQTAAALDILDREELFPHPGFTEPVEEAEKRLSDQRRKLCAPRILSMNAGFGGLNAALLIAKDGAA